MYNHLHTITTGNRILLLFMLMLIGLILAGGLITLIGAVINGSDGDAVAMIYIGTVLQSFIVFVVPAFLLAYSVDKNAFGYLGMSDNRRLGHHTLYTLAIFLFSYPFISFLSQWNSQMVLPEAFSELEKTMRSMEDAAMETTKVILSLDSVGGMLLNLLVVALLAALSEELFFREHSNNCWENGSIAVMQPSGSRRLFSAWFISSSTDFSQECCWEHCLATSFFTVAISGFQLSFTLSTTLR